MTKSRTGENVPADQDAGTPVARIEHQVPGRIRFRVPSMRGDAAFFGRVAEALRAQDGVVAVRTNALTASVLIEHRIGTEGVVSLAAAKALFQVTGPQDAQMPLADDGVRPAPKAAVLSSVAVAFTALGAYQLARGRVAGSTVDLLWKSYGAYASLGLPWASAALIGLGLYALANRRVLSPAGSLFYYALSARHMAQQAAR